MMTNLDEVSTPCRRDAVQETLTACRAGGQVNTGALAGGLFGARLQIIGAWLFLNVFSVFAGYFIIGRPILFQSLGIDLLPTLHDIGNRNLYSQFFDSARLKKSGFTLQVCSCTYFT